MLVLTRKLGESLVIGNNITVTVLRIQGHCVRLGIDAPRDMPIIREELKPSDLSMKPNTATATL